MITINYTSNNFYIRLEVKGIDLTGNCPKSCKAKHVTDIIDWDNSDPLHAVIIGKHDATVVILNCEPSINNIKNEAGIKRLAQFVKSIKKIDTVEFINASKGYCGETELPSAIVNA